MGGIKTKEKLLGVATHLFAEHGFNGVTIRDISKISGISISMISYHFGGKHALYACILREQFTCFAYVESLETMDLTPLLKLRNYIRWSVRKHENNDFSKIYLNETVHPTKHYETIIKPLFEKSFSVLSKIICDCKQDGYLKTNLNTTSIISIIVTTSNFNSMLNKITYLGDSHADCDIETMTNDFIDIISNGVCVDHAMCRI